MPRLLSLQTASSSSQARPQYGTSASRILAGDGYPALSPWYRRGELTISLDPPIPIPAHARLQYK
jgi:hypothetical protein